MRRAFTLAVFVAVLHVSRASVAMSAGPDSSSALDRVLANPNVRWASSALHPAFRERAHFSASRVSPFPHEDLRWMNARNWPTLNVIEGVACSLRVETCEHGDCSFIPSVIWVKPGALYSLFYTDVQDARWKSEDSHRGPTYTWRADGALRDRYWKSRRKTRLRTREYMYYPSGRLFRYTERMDRYDPRRGSESPLESLDEVFASDGTLIGCAYRKGDRDATSVDVGYWLGKDVGPREFLNRAAEAQTRAMR